MSNHHDVVIIGGGNAGISVAARLHASGIKDIALVEPSTEHFYQPLWTLVGGGCVAVEKSRRLESSVIPGSTHWIQQRATALDPDNSTVTLNDGDTLQYNTLVLCPGIQANWEGIDGLAAAVSGPQASSNYRYDLAPKTWELIQKMRSGRALFTAPTGPIKCGGAPQKIAYLAADYWRRQGVLDNIEITLALPSEEIFSVPLFARTLYQVASRYGINLRLAHELQSIDAENNSATFTHHGETKTIDYDFAHYVPPQSAPDWIRASPVASPEDPYGYIAVNSQTLQHPKFANVFSLGDAAALPTSKTGAAVRKQAPVLVENLLRQRAGKPLDSSYNGYSSCPLTTARGKVVLAEFLYENVPAPSFPLINTSKERYDMWLLKRYSLPFLYWNFILKGKM